MRKGSHYCWFRDSRNTSILAKYLENDPVCLWKVSINVFFAALSQTTNLAKTHVNSCFEQ